MIKKLINGLVYFFTMQWVEDSGQFVIRKITAGKVVIRDTQLETVSKDLKDKASFFGKLSVVLKAIFRFLICTEIGILFLFIVIFCLALLFVLLFGPIKEFHQW